MLSNMRIDIFNCSFISSLNLTISPRSRNWDDEVIDVHTDDEPSTIVSPIVDGMLVLALAEPKLARGVIELLIRCSRSLM
jgi:hypothetical protein